MKTISKIFKLTAILFLFARSASAALYVNGSPDRAVWLTITKTVSLEHPGVISSYTETQETRVKPGHSVEYPEDYEQAVPDPCLGDGFFRVTYTVSDKDESGVIKDAGSVYDPLPDNSEIPDPSTTSGNGEVDPYTNSVEQGTNLELTGWSTGNGNWFRVAFFLDPVDSFNTGWAGDGSKNLYRPDKDANCGWSKTISTSGLSVGQHTIKLGCAFIDADGNFSSWGTVITFHVTAPQ